MDTKEGNRLIAEFMGYKYFEPNVLIDFSDCGGMYFPKDIYSKVPIQVNDYGEGEKYFTKLPNPDYKNENNPRWSRAIEELDWDTLNFGEYIYDLEYHSSWNALMPVIEIIEQKYLYKINIELHCCRFIPYSQEYDTDCFKYHQISMDNGKIGAVYSGIVKFIKWHNEKK